MVRAAFATLIGVGLLSTSAMAFEVTGGSIGLGHSKFVTSPLNNLEKTTLEGSAQVGISPTFSMQGDLAVSDFGVTSGNSSSIGLHGIFHVNESVDLGVYAGRDNFASTGFGNNGDVNYYGFEVAHQSYQLETEAYVGVVDGDAGNGTNLGLSGRYELTDMVGLGANFDTAKIGDQRATRMGVTGDFAFSDTTRIEAEVGRGKIGNQGTEAYVGLGAKINFGGNQGTSFGQRGLINLLPGL